MLKNTVLDFHARNLDFMDTIPAEFDFAESAVPEYDGSMKTLWDNVLTSSSFAVEDAFDLLEVLRPSTSPPLSSDYMTTDVLVSYKALFESAWQTIFHGGMEDMAQIYVDQVEEDQGQHGQKRAHS